MNASPFPSPPGKRWESRSIRCHRLSPNGGFTDLVFARITGLDLHDCVDAGCRGAVLLAAGPTNSEKLNRLF